MILDTNAVSALADGEPGLHDVLDFGKIRIPVIVVGEYRFGLRFSRARNQREEWLRALLKATTILVIDETTADHYAEVHSDLRRRGTPIPQNDMWIAALGRQYDLPIVTRDQHFELVPCVRTVRW